MSGFPTLRLALNTAIGKNGITLSPTKTPAAVSVPFIFAGADPEESASTYWNANAFVTGDGSIAMTYGNGDGKMFREFATDPDVSAHEAAHQAALKRQKMHPQLSAAEIRQRRIEYAASAPARFQREYSKTNGSSLLTGVSISYITDRDYFVAAMLHAVTNDLPQLSATIESARRGTIDGCWGAPSSETVVTHILNRMSQEGRLPAGYSSAAQVWERIHELSLIAGEE